MDLKSGQPNKNAPLYDAEGSFVLVRQKNKVELLTQSAEKIGFVWGNGLFLVRQFYFSGFRRAPGAGVQIFQGLHFLPMLPLRHVEQEGSSRDKERIIYCLGNDWFL